MRNSPLPTLRDSGSGTATGGRPVSARRHARFGRNWLRGGLWPLVWAGIAPWIAAASPDASTADPADGWWRSAVFYQVFVRSFQDASQGPWAGDGVGDFQGLIERLDYLNDGDPATDHDLGVDALWLMPICESGSYHGYDVIDYFAVDREYGDTALFRRFLAEAHRRGVRVILDFVLNHASHDHPWFREAIREDLDPLSPYREYFRFSDEPLQPAGPWGEPCWRYYKGEYFYGVFSSGMPDWNFRHPEVDRHHRRAAEFWLREMGVDGFRLDAVRYFFEDGALLQDAPATLDWLRDYGRFVREIQPAAFLVGEAWTDSQQVATYVRHGCFQTAFEFDLAKATLEAVKFGTPFTLQQRMDKVREFWGEIPPATFLANHDQERTASQLEGDLDRARVAAGLLFALPGVPFLYYGEELGLTGRKPDEQLRLPMPWSEGPGLGFTTGTPWQAPPPEYAARSVARASSDPASLLSHYRRLIRLRQSQPALRHGGFLPIPVDGRGLYAFARTLPEETLVVLGNLRAQPTRDYGLRMPEAWREALARATPLAPTADSSAASPARFREDGLWQPLEEIPPLSVQFWRIAPVFPSD